MRRWAGCVLSDGLQQKFDRRESGMVEEAWC